MKTEFDSCKLIYLHPGEVYFTIKPEVISTVLGSCLTVTMFNKETGLSGISHALLPNCKTSLKNCEKCIEPFKYVDCSIKIMIKKFDANKISRRNIEVKMFGAAEMMESSNQNTAMESVAKKNILTALDILENENLSLSASDLGGRCGRRIIFFTKDGSVYLKRLNNNEKN